MATETAIRPRQPTLKRRVYRALFVVLVLVVPLFLAFGSALVGTDSSGDGDMQGVGVLIFAFLGFVLWLMCLLVGEIALWVRRISATRP